MIRVKGGSCCGLIVLSRKACCWVSFMCLQPDQEMAQLRTPGELRMGPSALLQRVHNLRSASLCSWGLQPLLPAAWYIAQGGVMGNWMVKVFEDGPPSPSANALLNSRVESDEHVICLSGAPNMYFLIYFGTYLQHSAWWLENSHSLGSSICTCWQKQQSHHQLPCIPACLTAIRHLTSLRIGFCEY